MTPGVIHKFLLPGGHNAPTPRHPVQKGVYWNKELQLRQLQLLTLPSKRGVMCEPVREVCFERAAIAKKFSGAMVKKQIFTEQTQFSPCRMTS
jgi:hypothetical protein